MCKTQTNQGYIHTILGYNIKAGVEGIVKVRVGYNRVWNIRIRARITRRGLLGNSFILMTLGIITLLILILIRRRLRWISFDFSLYYFL
jgi:hypothetical protein